MDYIWKSILSRRMIKRNGGPNWHKRVWVCSSAWQNMSWHFLRWHFGDLAKILVTKFCQGKMAWHFVLWHFGDLEKILVTKFCQGKMSRHFVPWHFGDLEKFLVTKFCQGKMSGMEISNDFLFNSQVSIHITKGNFDGLPVRWKNDGFCRHMWFYLGGITT